MTLVNYGYLSHFHVCHNLGVVPFQLPGLHSLCHPRSALSPSTYGGAGAHLSALQGFEMKLTASI
jgi:hypothetical protein